MKIPPFKEINPPTKDGFWINKKTKESLEKELESEMKELNYL